MFLDFCFLVPTQLVKEFGKVNGRRAPPVTLELGILRAPGLLLTGQSNFSSKKWIFCLTKGKFLGDEQNS
jgi:hypothetical protein